MKTFIYNSKMNELELLKLLTQFIIYNLNKSKNATEFFKTLQKSNIQTVLDKNKNLTFNVKNDQDKLVKSFKIDDLNSPDLTKQGFIERFKDFLNVWNYYTQTASETPNRRKLEAQNFSNGKTKTETRFFV